jgi:hypothetical protein
VYFSVSSPNPFAKLRKACYEQKKGSEYVSLEREDVIRQLDFTYLDTEESSIGAKWDVL